MSRKTLKNVFKSLLRWKGGGVILACIVAGVFSQSASAGWLAGTPIDDVDITNPVANEVWLAGSDHTLTATAVEDCDCNTTTGTLDDDSVTHYWTGTGTFKSNDNIGTSVTYICTNTAGTNTVTVYADDDYAPDDNNALYDEEPPTSDEETVSVIIPEVDQITYVGAKKHTIYDVTTPEYTRSPAKNEPTSYTKGVHNDATCSVKFWGSSPLTESSDVDVYCSPSTYALGEWGYPSGTFGTSWPTGAFQCTWGQINRTYVSKLTYDEVWKYRCPTGSNTYISMPTVSNRVMYIVWGAPQCAASLYTKANLDICTGWANGCNKVDTSDDTTNIPHQVQHGAKAWHQQYGWKSTGIKPNPFTWIPANKGDCITYADLMTKGCQLLGITASSEYIECRDSYPNGALHRYFSSDLQPYWATAGGDADGDGTTNENEAGYPGTIDGVYVKGSDPDHNAAWRAANYPWNFHGACSCAGHWWEITFYCTPDHDTAANMRSWPNGPVIDYPGHLEPNGQL